MAKAKFTEPETKENTDPSRFGLIVPAWGEGSSKVINGQTAVYVPSPFPQHPGGVWVPYLLNPAQFDRWYKTMMARAERDAETRNPNIMDYWSERYHFVLEWDMGGITPDMVTADGMNMPDTQVIAWVGAIGSDLIIRATSFPNLPAPSKGGVNGSGASD